MDFLTLGQSSAPSILKSRTWKTVPCPKKMHKGKQMTFKEKKKSCTLFLTAELCNSLDFHWGLNLSASLQSHALCVIIRPHLL